MKVLLTTTYFGPIQWYQQLYRADEAVIEQWESFQKQTYRNRCIIASANGPQALTVPVEKFTVHSLRFTDDYPAGSEGLTSKSAVNRQPSTVNKTIRDIRISDHGNWRHLHWNALQSAYGHSPFFEYYQDDIRPFFERHWDYLFDFNEAIRQTMCELLDIQPNVSFSSEFMGGTMDSRGRGGAGAPRPYYQVYQQRHGFLPNLSILDLLFNMGPESIFWL